MLKASIFVLGLFIYLIMQSVVWGQTNQQSSGDILDFIPAIIAASKKPVDPPKPPPISGKGNFRAVKVDVFRRINPIGKLSDNSLTWDSAGNIVGESLNTFDVFGGQPSQIVQSINVSRSFNTNNDPVSESFSTTPDSVVQTTGNKQYIYTGTRLTKLISTGSFNDTPLPPIETNYTYNSAGRLTGALVTNNQNVNEQHSLTYNNINQIISRQVIDSAGENINFTYGYDATGNLVEITREDDETELTRTFQPISGNQQVTRSFGILKSNGEILVDDDFITTYAPGVCTIQTPNSGLSIETSITFGPAPPHLGCLTQ